MDNLIYLDNNATTRLDPRVLDEMLPYLKEEYGNPSSTHAFGATISRAVDLARIRTAELINASASDMIFTSGATESINLALKAASLVHQRKGKHIITVSTEHKAVLDTASFLESIGFEVTYLPVKGDGIIDLDDLKQQLREDTILVSVMFVNNETGVIQPVKEIAEAAHASGALFMTDATQAVGKIPVDVEELDVDLLAFSGHKFYGPKGIGGLFVRNLKKSRLGAHPLLHGGGHEGGLRSGTLNVPGIVGLGKAAQLAKEEMAADQLRIGELRDLLEQELLKIPGAYVNGTTSSRIYNTSNICFPGIDANVLIGKLKNIAVSNGSACTAAIVEPSHVLKAMELSDENALSAIRFSLGRYTKLEEVYFTKNIISKYLTQPVEL